MDDDVECIAKAFYALQNEACRWDSEPDGLKEAFRSDARTALAMVDAGIEARRRPATAWTD